jgi:hypothetical protein
LPVIRHIEKGCFKVLMVASQPARQRALAGISAASAARSVGSKDVRAPAAPPCFLYSPLLRFPLVVSGEKTTTARSSFRIVKVSHQAAKDAPKRRFHCKSF